MKGLEKMICDTYIKNIEALPNFGGWVIYLDSGKIIKTRDDSGKIPHRL